jgi:hypothetical protein
LCKGFALILLVFLPVCYLLACIKISEMKLGEQI